MVTVGSLEIAQPLHDFVETALTPGSSVAAADFWAALERVVADLGPRNDALLARRDEIAARFAETPGVAEVLHGDARAAAGLDHSRAGDLVLVSDRDRWFCHDWWLDDARAPDWQRTVDIHRKPGYDPRELFVDPKFRFPKLAIGSRLVRRKLGFRTLLDVIPTDTSLVRGSHGRVDQGLGWDAMLVADAAAAIDDDEDGRVPCTAVRDLALGTMFG